MAIVCLGGDIMVPEVAPQGFQDCTVKTQEFSNLLSSPSITSVLEVVRDGFYEIAVGNNG